MKILLVALMLINFGGCTKKRDLSKLEYIKPFKNLSDDSLFIIFSSSIEGYLESCGCTSAPLGDIARFTQVFDDIKTHFKKPVLFIDTGNLIFDSASRNPADLCQDNARIELLLSTFKNLGLQQTIIGPFDNARGPAYQQEFYKKMALQAFSKPLDSRILKFGDHTIGLIGIRETLPRENLEELVNKIAHSKPNLIIAMSQLPKDQTLKLFENIKKIDIVLQGQTEAFAPARPKKLGETGPLFVEGGRQENYFPILLAQNLNKRENNSLVFDDRAYEHNAETELIKSRLKSLKTQLEEASLERREFLKKRIELQEKELKSLVAKNKNQKPLRESSLLFYAIPLSKNIEASPQVKKELSVYEKSIPALVAECERDIECPKVTPKEASYVGAEVCKSCHQQAYEVWQKAIYYKEGQDEKGQAIKRQMGHSKAWKTLVEKNKDKDRSCVDCHSIGFMKPGGYCKVSDVGFRVNVQCESCHGPGSLHAQNGNKKYIKNPTEQTCRECHQVPHIESYESFNYEERLQKILGPGHGERLLRELKHKAKVQG